MKRQSSPRAHDQKIIDYIQKNEPIESMSQIHKALGMHPSTVNSIVNRLAKKRKLGTEIVKGKHQRRVFIVEPHINAPGPPAESKENTKVKGLSEITPESIVDTITFKLTAQHRLLTKQKETIQSNERELKQLRLDIQARDKEFKLLKEAYDEITKTGSSRTKKLFRALGVGGD